MAKVRKRGERYFLDYYYHEGKRQRPKMPKGTTQKAAKEKLRKIEEQLAKGNYIPTQEIPTFDRVALEWLELKKLNIRASTWQYMKAIPGTTLMNFRG